LKVLYIGDPHVQVSNLDESDRLMDFVVDTSIKHTPDMIVLLGDLFHNFAIVRTEVLDFWKDWLDTLSESQKLIVIIGNHDLANSGNDSYKSHALNTYKLMKKDNLYIVDSAQVHGPFGFIPYTHDQEKFMEIANGLKNYGAKILVVHQDINGSQYENGYYASGGIDPSKLDYPLIIGGHIHKRERFGKVILPGTPRWLTSSDSNEPKGLWLVNHNDETGLIESEEFIDTSSVCTPIYQITYKEGEQEPIIPEKARVSLELIGSSDWISKEKIKFKGKASIKTKFTDIKKTESRKTGTNFIDFLKNLYPATTDKEQLLKLAQELQIV
jgi:DNA repair exonuclease SbcCD nuclease subunit